MKRIFFASLFVATAALAGPYDQAYSIVTTDRAKSADPNLRPVIVKLLADKSVRTRGQRRGTKYHPGGGRGGRPLRGKVGRPKGKQRSRRRGARKAAAA